MSILDENKMSIVLLSTAANVISCHTSMVGIDKNRKEKVAGDLMRRSVPIMSDRSFAYKSNSFMACSAQAQQYGCSQPVVMDTYGAPFVKLFGGGAKVGSTSSQKPCSKPRSQSLIKCKLQVSPSRSLSRVIFSYLFRN